MQAQALAPPYAHAQLQPVETIQAMCALSVDQPTLTPQQNMDTQVAEARPVKRQFANAHTQRRLVLGPAAPIPARADGYVNPWAGLNFGTSADNGRGGFGVSVCGAPPTCFKPPALLIAWIWSCTSPGLKVPSS